MSPLWARDGHAGGGLAVSALEGTRDVPCKPSDAALLGRQSLGRALQGSQDARQIDLLPPQRRRRSQTGAAGGRAPLSGDLDRIRRAEMRSERNRLRALWRRDPREPGRTIMLVGSDEATCRAWAAQQGFQLDLLDDLPAVSDAYRWIWARMSRGLISDDDLTAKLARLRSRIMEEGHAFDHSR
jgi:hypothetical protein